MYTYCTYNVHSQKVTLQFVQCIFCVVTCMQCVHLEPYMHNMLNFPIYGKCVCSQNVQQLITKHDIRCTQLIGSGPYIKPHAYHNKLLPVLFDEPRLQNNVIATVIFMCNDLQVMELVMATEMYEYTTQPSKITDYIVNCYKCPVQSYLSSYTCIYVHITICIVK